MDSELQDCSFHKCGASFGAGTLRGKKRADYTVESRTLFAASETDVVWAKKEGDRSLDGKAIVCLLARP